MRLVFIGMALALAASAPAHAAWKEYEFKELEVAKDFPTEPKMTKGVYKTPLAVEAPETVYSVSEGGITYKFSIVDFTKRPGDGANLVGEAARTLIDGKDVTYALDDFPLYDKGTASVYGTLISFQKPDGERSKAGIFFNRGRLYIIHVVVAADSPNRNTSNVARFMDSIRFHMAGYGFDYETGHDFPIGDDRPGNRDLRVIPGYKPPPPLPDPPTKK